MARLCPVRGSSKRPVLASGSRAVSENQRVFQFERRFGSDMLDPAYAVRVEMEDGDADLRAGREQARRGARLMIDDRRRPDHALMKAQDLVLLRAVVVAPLA